MATEPRSGDPIRLPAPIEPTSATCEIALPDPMTDLEGWLVASLERLEGRFEAFITHDSRRRSIGSRRGRDQA